MNSKRRKTILRESNIFDIPTKYEALSQSEKIANLQYHLLEIGTLSKNSLSPEYFDCLPPLTELEIETISTLTHFWMKQIVRFPKNSLTLI